jgi:hypothetical protein
MLDVMRAWSRASQLMCNHTSGVVGYLYRVWDAVAKNAAAPWLRGKERKQAVRQMANGYPVNVPKWVLDRAQAAIETEKQRLATRAVVRSRRGDKSSQPVPCDGDGSDDQLMAAARPKIWRMTA